MRLLLVEDHQELAEWLAKSLRQAGYAVDLAMRGDHADQFLQSEKIDVVVLDLSLPGMDGLEVLRRLRQRGGSMPVLVLTARGATDERVKGLNMGADDYLPKPFEFAELEARLKALLRRGVTHAPVIQVGNLSFDTTSRLASMNGQPLSLTPKETAVLEALLVRRGRPVSREALFEMIYSLEEDARAEAIEIYVHRVRKKLEGTGVSIRTMRGLGYLLE